MRQKKIKNLTIQILEQKGVITKITPIDLIGYKQVALEVGSGKGKFISELAKDHPDTFFIAFEINMSVLYRIWEKKDLLQLDNLLIILGDANHLFEYFSASSIDTIYLNFSDPWPKVKHHKRRLTYPKFLKQYQHLLKAGGKLEFRTDHESFFLDSVEYFKETFTQFETNLDLPVSNYMTEYEIAKRAVGPIMQIKGVKNEHSKSV